MLLFRRFGLLALLLLVALLAIGSIHGLSSEQSSESQAESSAQAEEFLDEYGQDYEDQSYHEEGGDIASPSPSPQPQPPVEHQPKHEQGGYPVPPPPQQHYPPPVHVPLQPQLPAYKLQYPQQQQQYKPQQPVQPSYASDYSFLGPASYPLPESYQEIVYQPQVSYYSKEQQYVHPPPKPIVPLPIPTYQPPKHQQQQQQQYVQPQQHVQQPHYQPPVATNYSAPKYVQPTQPAYQQPVVQKPYVAPVAPVVHMKPQIYQPQQQYSSQHQHQQHHPKPYMQHQQQPVVGSNYTTTLALGNKYSLIDLAPFIAPFGYKSNHWSLFYYRSQPYRQCPKNMYLNAPKYQDIEAAFQWALKQLAMYQDNTIQYMNASTHSFTTRHQIFHILTQQNAKMDEQGLLVELVSTYLADRACLTKWDRQRYLPQLTKLISTSHFPGTHSCSVLYQNKWQGNLKYCLNSKYRTYDGFCNNPYHPYWGKANICHLRLLSPDYADGISQPRISINPKFPLPNPRAISNIIHFDLPIEGPYNMMKMQWGQFINHDITNTALSSYDGLVDCCKNPHIRGCLPIYVPPGDKFYSQHNVTCLNFIRSGVCPTCQLGPRQQINKNSAFLDLSHVYGHNSEVANSLRSFQGGMMRTSPGKNGEPLLPMASSHEQCSGNCFLAGDSRINQHPALTALHLLLMRNHNQHARALQVRHPNWNDEYIYQEARRINIAEYQMITYNEYLPIVFGPILSAYYKLYPQRSGYSYYEPKADPSTWNEYSTASCRFGHSQCQNTFGLYSSIVTAHHDKQPSFRMKDWFMRTGFFSEGLSSAIVNGLLSKSSSAVDPWIVDDVRNHLYQSYKEHSGGDLAATNIWRGREHGIPGYVHYVEYCFNVKVRGWKDLQMFIPYHTLNQLRRMYRVVENIDLFTGGLSERHFPGADTGPTFACINGIQYYHLKFGDRYYFEHGAQAGAFTPAQLEEIRRSTLARLLCRTSYIPTVPQYSFLAPSMYNPLVNCSLTGEINYQHF